MVEDVENLLGKLVRQQRLLRRGVPQVIQRWQQRGVGGLHWRVGQVDRHTIAGHHQRRARQQRQAKVGDSIGLSWVARDHTRRVVYKNSFDRRITPHAEQANRPGAGRRLRQAAFTQRHVEPIERGAECAAETVDQHEVSATTRQISVQRLTHRSAVR